MADIVIAKEDYKYFVEKPDPSFSPERNQKIFDETVRSATEYHNKIGRKISETLGIRTDIMAYYGDYVFNRGGSKTIDQYLGRNLVREMIGEKILEKVRAIETDNKLERGSIKIQL